MVIIHENIKSFNGLVPVSSAIDFPNSISDQLLYSNHQQMRNDRNTDRSAKDLLIKGKFGQFFVTPLK